MKTLKQGASSTQNTFNNKFPAQSEDFPYARVTSKLCQLVSEVTSSPRGARANAKLIIVRGLPGAGKSTFAGALALAGYAHYEADMFFEKNGTYQYDPSKIVLAHKWCQRMVREALERGRGVVVSNTFCEKREMIPYFSMTNDIECVEAHGKWQNKHGVSDITMKKMAQRWESLEHTN